ncbi:MAG TPA: patatin-like phospholipase family protein [Thermoanaerobaculia bacterium]|nr:patatin-like phospholipase family protein [Thermoanaerobaculia bacterium]
MSTTRDAAATALAKAQALIDKFPDLARQAILEAGELDRSGPHYIALRQLLARSIYKDEDLLAPQKYERARDILEADCDLANSTDGETLGLAGAVYKRLWDHTGQRTHLEQALAWYGKAYELLPDADGWRAVNTAYVLDLLAAQERKAGGEAAVANADARVKKADEIRREVLRKLNASGPPADVNPWFFHASRAEASFGLGDFDAAEEALADANAQGAAWLAKQEPGTARPLQKETTARQLAAIARLRFDGTANAERASRVVQHAFGLSETAVHGLFGGKIGIALSGGGFRASLFHIGVLAKLAELDVLRHVEVISCVSGGSIVGAFYYLELKKRLESGRTSREDYIEIVRDVEQKFLAGVRKNIRTRIAASFSGGFKMAFLSGYSRSDIVGELYQKHLFDKTAEDGQTAPRLMSQLKVKPAEHKDAGPFNPKYDNWRLDAKVPILVLNATTLNTGHNWQFTASWMGESPQAISATIDAIPRYRRMYYTPEAPKPYDEIPIGRAVGASACVPGLFEPIAMRSLYPDRTVRLVDGGVHDNQGLSSLLEQNCRVILVSDASGQMMEITNPGGSVSDSVGGANGILQARVREAQFDQLSALRRAGAIQGAMFIHLTKDLEAEPVSWIGAQDTAEQRRVQDPRTTYKVDRDVQRKLAAVRTDLDSFSDAEAYGLMTSGYLMTEHALLEEQCAPTLPIAGSREPWTFLGAEPALKEVGSPENQKMRTLLKVSNELTFKIWRQLWPLKVLAAVLLIAAVAGVVTAIVKNRAYQLPSLGVLAIIAGAIGLVKLTLWGLDKKRIYHKRLGELALGLAVAFIGWIAAGIHLMIFDPLFLRHGRWPAGARPRPQTASGARIPIKAESDAAVPAPPVAPTPKPPVEEGPRV